MDTKITLLLVVVSTAIVSFLLSFLIHYSNINSSSENVDLTAEIVALKPKKDTMDLIRLENCLKLEKSDTVWTISGCKDDITIYLFIKPTGGYYMRICGNWTDGREVAERVDDVLRVLGIEVNCDLNSINFLRKEEEYGNVDVYNVCGKELYLSNGCII